jgi:hypothetical protein
VTVLIKISRRFVGGSSGHFGLRLNAGGNASRVRLALVYYNFGAFFKTGLFLDDLSVVLEPGDVIVVNTNWWMHSTSVVQDLSVTITNEYM